MIGDLIIHLDANISPLQARMKQAKEGLNRVDESADKALFSLTAIGRALDVVGRATAGLTRVAASFNLIEQAARLSTLGVMTVAGSINAVGGSAMKSSVAIGLISLPLKGIVTVAKVAKTTMLGLASVIIAPFRLAGSVIAIVTKGLWALAKPLLSIAKFAFQVRMAIMGLGLQFKILGSLLGMLSPRMKLVVAGLTAVGLASRVSSGAVGVLSLGLKAGTVAFLAFTNPVAAAKIGLITLASAAVHATRAVLGLGVAFASAGRSLVANTIATTAGAFRLLARSAFTAAAAIGKNLVTGLISAAKWVGIISVGFAGWGLKLHGETEAATSGFETMLKSQKAAEQVMRNLTSFASKTPFKIPELRDSSKQLLNAGITTGRLIDKLTMLGDIAAATGKPLGDFTRIYAKVGSTGRVELETLNQLAERGVPIYDALAKQMGVNRAEMLKMIRTGKVGFTDLDAALQSITTGAGVFAGGMVKLSALTLGLLSTLSDSVSMLAESLGKLTSNALGLKGGLQSTINFTDRLKVTVEGLEPAFQAVGDVARASFGSIQTAAGLTFAAIRAMTGITGGSVMEGYMKMAGIAEYAWGHIGTLAELGFTTILLSAVTTFENIKHFFTGVMPAVFGWFMENWQNIFQTIGNFTLTVFKNLGSNIRAIWTGVLDFFRGKGFQVDFTPLTEGFKNTIAELPDIPDRILGDYEKNLAKKFVDLHDKISTGLEDTIAKNMARLEAFRNKPFEAEQDLMAEKKEEEVEESSGGSRQRSQQLGIMERGSAEAMRAILGAGENKQLAETKKQTKAIQDGNKLLGKIALKSAGNFGANLKIQPGV